MTPADENRGLFDDIEKTVNDIAIGLTILIAFFLGGIGGFAVCGVLTHFRAIAW